MKNKAHDILSSDLAEIMREDVDNTILKKLKEPKFKVKLAWIQEIQKAKTSMERTSTE